MTFNPSRLVLARKRRGMSKTALQKKADLSLRLLGYYEAGTVKPSDEALSALSQALKFPVEFFCRPDIDEIVCDAASFRSLTTKTASQRDAAIAAGTLAIALDEWIGQRFELPKADVPDLTGLDPETAAEMVRTEWGLGQKPIHNVVHLAEAHGIKVYSLPVDSAVIDAFSVWHKEKMPLIFLNPTKSGERGRMDVGHEIGHLVIHHQGSPRSRQAEVQANNFASAFLMPAGDVLANAPRGITLDLIHQMKKRWKVSAIALVYRLWSLRLLTEWQYRMFCKQLSIAGYRRSEKDGIPRETSQVLGKVFEALRRDGISRASIARELSITSDELNSLVAGLVISAIPTDGSSGTTVTRNDNTEQKERPVFRLVK